MRVPGSPARQHCVTQAVIAPMQQNEEAERSDAPPFLLQLGAVLGFEPPPVRRIRLSVQL